MREIKFRIWDINERKFVVNETDRLGYGDTKKCMSERVDFENNSVEINADESYILSEYTGLKDMDGKEIYEGDILLSSDENGIFLISIDFGYPNIEYSNMLTGFQIKTEIILSNSQYFEYFSNNLIELINKYNIPMKEDNNAKYISDGWWILGNIYENTELLGDKNDF